MRDRYWVFLSLLFLFAPTLLWGAVPDAVQTVDQGPIQSVDLANNRITVNNRTYRTRRNVDVIRQSSEGVSPMDPSRLAPNMEVRLEEENGIIIRVRVLDPR
jgi:hypothetical protein